MQVRSSAAGHLAWVRTTEASSVLSSALRPTPAGRGRGACDGVLGEDMWKTPAVNVSSDPAATGP